MGELPFNMSEVRVHASFTVAPEDVASLLAEAKVMIAETQKEPGCIHYQLYKEAGKETSFAMIEAWATIEQLKAHGQSAHVKNFQAASKDKVKAVIQSYTPI